jgi:hypothetical protein
MTGIAGAVSGVLVSGEIFAGERSADSVTRFGREEFRTLIGSAFVLSGPRSAQTATLAKVIDFPVASKTGECFGLVFETSENRIEEGVYNVFSQQTGNLEIFLGVGRNGRRSALVATINRL